MRFALLGDHPDGVELARALLGAGHSLLAYASSDPALRFPEPARRVPDLEDVLADPAVETVLVAGSAFVRPGQLRRALQSERHVVCVHPADDSPEIAYEADLLQRDTGFGLLPLLVEALHPAFRRLAGLIARAAPESSPLGVLRLLLVERGSSGEVLLNARHQGLRPGIPGWDVLRALGGEVAEVLGLAEGEVVGPGEPVTVAGRFRPGGLFQMTLLPDQRTTAWRYVVIGSAGRAELIFPQGWVGPASLGWRDPSGEEREEYWEPWDPWPEVVPIVEAACVRQAGRTVPGWQDEVRSLELDEAARRSIQKRRSDVLDYQEVSEEVGFKGTMTLLGCSLLWVSLVLLVASRWKPTAWVGWLILPLLLGFVALQFLRYLLPRPDSEAAQARSSPEVPAPVNPSLPPTEDNPVP